MQRVKPLLILTLGIPGSGKTLFSRRFAKERGFFHLNSDRVRLEMFTKPKYSPAEHNVVFRVMDYIASELLSRGISVIYDANTTKRADRARLRALAKRHGGRAVLLWFKTPTTVALTRIKRRALLKSQFLKMYHRPLDATVMFRIKREIERPTVREPHVLIDSTKPYREQIRALWKVLR